MTNDTLQASEETSNEQTIQDVNTPAIPENGAESVPAEEEKVSFDDRQQAKVNALIGEKSKATHAERRRADAAEAKLAEIEAARPKPIEPEIPSMPDTLDDDYEQQVIERDKAIERRAEFRANANFQAEEAKKRQQNTLYEQQQKRTEAGNTFAERSRKLGFEDADMGQSIIALQEMGLGNDFQQELVAYANGPEVVDYLSKHPESVDKMRGMSLMQAGSYIAADVVPKALNANKATNAPPPVDYVNGAGSQVKERGPKGATYT